MTEYDERKLAKDHKNPAYDSDEDGVVEASQLPEITGLSEGSMSSGEFVKFDGSSLVGGTVETSELSWQEDSNSPHSFSGKNSIDLSIQDNFDMLMILMKIKNPTSSVQGRITVNNISSSDYQVKDGGNLKTGESNWYYAPNSVRQNTVIAFMLTGYGREISIKPLISGGDSYEYGKLRAGSVINVNSIQINDTEESDITAKVFGVNL